MSKKETNSRTQFVWYNAEHFEKPYKILADFEQESGKKIRTSKRFSLKEQALSFFENNIGFCLLSKTNIEKQTSEILRYKFK